MLLKLGTITRQQHNFVEDRTPGKVKWNVKIARCNVDVK